MDVKALIQILNTMPLDAKVYHIWDGEPRTAINVVYLSKSGNVMTADFKEFVYNDMARPVGCEISGDGYHFKTAENPKGDYNPEDEWDYNL